MCAKAKSSSKITGLSIPGRVIKNTGSAYQVRTEAGEIMSCRIKGNFRIKGIRTTNPVTVGDWVEIKKASDDAYYIVNILPRKNYIIRKASNLSKESHILAANIDQALLVATIFNPETPLTFIDRFLATCEAYEVPCIIVLNKCDTWTPELLAYAYELQKDYQQIGYKVIFTSTVSKQGISELRSLAKDKISLLAGNSGVGKSSLINTLIPGANLKTGEVSDIHHTGTHTTTFSEMIQIPEGGDLIDIPGIKGFGTLDFTPQMTDHYFPEIFRESSQCKYADCLHIEEPGCAVRNAVEEGKISTSRFNSYLSILNEINDGPENSKYRKPF